MPETPSIHGHCDPRFEAVRQVFAENLENGNDLGAGVAFTLHGEPVVDQPQQKLPGYEHQGSGRMSLPSTVDAYSLHDAPLRDRGD